MSQPHYDFTNVDGAAAPHSHVTYLDAMSALELTRAYKQRGFAMLGAQAGAHILDVGCGTGDDVRTLAQTVGSVVISEEAKGTFHSSPLSCIGGFRLTVPRVPARESPGPGMRPRRA